MNSVEQVMEKGLEMELEGVNFVDQNGVFSSVSKNPPVLVEIIFIDKTVMKLTYSQFRALDNFKFKLRPALSN